MIEKKFVEQKMKELQIEEFINRRLKNVGHSKTRLQRTPLGEKIIISTSHPGLVVGRKGDNIKDLTNDLRNEFKLENPQIEISEVEEPNLDARIVGEKIASTLERFGSNKFKGVGHKTMADVMNAGALGVEILISGKIPGARAKTWRFYQGYLKKCGDIAITGVKEANVYAQLKSGTIGVKVRIMPPDVQLPDRVHLLDQPTILVEEVKKEEIKIEQKPEKKERKPRKRKTGEGVKEPSKEHVKEPSKEPVKETFKEPAKDHTKEHFKEPSQEPVKEALKEPSKEPVEETLEEPSEEPVKETRKESSKEHTKEHVKETFKEPSKEHVKAHFKETSQEPVKETFKEPSKEHTKEHFKEASEEPVKETFDEPSEDPSDIPPDEPEEESEDTDNQREEQS